MRSLIYVVLGVIVFALGLWMLLSLGFTFLAMVGSIIAGVGGALVVAGIAVSLDAASPTSRKI